MQIRLSPDVKVRSQSVGTEMTVDELLARFPEVPRDLREELAQKPSPCVGDGGDMEHVFYTRLLNDLAIYGIGLARRERTLARLQATLDQHALQPATFACTLVPRKAPGEKRAGCG